MSAIIDLPDQPQAASLDGLASFSTPEWLAGAAQPANVWAALVRQIPEFASGEWKLRDLEIKRMRLRHENGWWTGTYRLTVVEPSGIERVVPIHGTLVPPGMAGPERGADEAPWGAETWHCYLPSLRLHLRTQPPEKELTVLPRLINPDAARALLEGSLRGGSPAFREVRLRAVTPQVLRYKPGSRCTVLYHVEYSDGADPCWPEAIIAKTHHGDKGRNAYEAMCALWNSPLATSRAVTIAEPLAYLPEMSLLLQGPIHEETTLNEFIQSALGAGTPEALGELRDYVRKTAAGLAELHRCGVSCGETATWEGELAEIRQRRQRLAIPIPPLADAGERLMAHLEVLAAEHPADPPGPAHRSFRPAQVLLYEGEIGFIDFDGFCQAEPAMDVALFMTLLKHIALSKTKGDDEEEDEESFDPELRLVRLAQIEALCELLLSEYEARAPISRQRIALWEALDLLTLIFGAWTKIKIGRLNNSLLMLERHLRAMRVPTD